MRYAQKMMIVAEHLMQSVEIERRITAPAQLTTSTCLDQDIKHITGS